MFEPKCIQLFLIRIVISLKDTQTSTVTMMALDNDLFSLFFRVCVLRFLFTFFFVAVSDLFISV